MDFSHASHEFFSPHLEGSQDTSRYFDNLENPGKRLTWLGFRWAKRRLFFPRKSGDFLTTSWGIWRWFKMIQDAKNRWNQECQAKQVDFGEMAWENTKRGKGKLQGNTKQGRENTIVTTHKAGGFPCLILNFQAQKRLHMLCIWCQVEKNQG